MVEPKISIIIPCYNSESTLEETLESVLKQDYKNWEAIIVNDGSPDNLENIALKFVNLDNRFRYFKKKNGGLASARNHGILNASGKYILPLDSDNKIRQNFLSKAILTLDSNLNFGVFYTNSNFFGAINRINTVGEFNLYKLLDENYIDACAIIRKSLFEDLGLYDEDMPYQGHEDWEFWIRVASNTNYKFYYCKEILYDYRVSNKSMIRSFSSQMKQDNVDYIIKKYCRLYKNVYSELICKLDYFENNKNNSIIKKIINYYRN